MWAIFHCMALACLVLEYGHEDDTDLEGWDTEIVHFDFKPENGEFP